MHFDLTELGLTASLVRSISSIGRVEDERVFPLAGSSQIKKMGRTRVLKFGKNWKETRNMQTNKKKNIRGQRRKETKKKKVKSEK